MTAYTDLPLKTESLTMQLEEALKTAHSVSEKLAHVCQRMGCGKEVSQPDDKQSQAPAPGADRRAVAGTVVELKGVLRRIREDIEVCEKFVG